MARDARLVQTAVLDSADSEEPVECPTEAPEMRIFRREYLERTFWCGTWLGGCGGELTDRLCTDKVCHFAHKADPDAVDSPCRRRSGGAGTGSADHLYIKAALADWMASHNTPGGTRIPQDPSGHVRLGAQVTAEPAGHLPLHFILDETAMPALGQSTVGLVFGEHVEPPSGLLRENGFVHRVRCVPDGAHRRTQIGTEDADGSIDWRDLTADHVQLTEHGLSTKTSAEIHRRRTQTIPIGARAPRPAPQKTPITRSAPAAEPVQETDRDEFAATLRTALKEKVGITQLQRHLDRMESAVRSGATLKETELLRQAHEVMMRLRRGVGAPAPAAKPRKRETAKRSTPPPVPLERPRVPGHSRLSGQNSQASRAELKNPFIQDRDTQAAVRKVRGVLRKHSRGRTNLLNDREVRAGFAAALNLAQEKLLHGERTSAKALLARWTTPQRPADEKAGLSPQALSAAAVAVRGALKRAAREQRTTTWGRLRSELGSALPAMTAAERTRTLTLVDEDSAAADQPLLSVLVAASNPVMARTYQQVVHNLDLAAPEDDDVLFDVIEADTEHVHRFWKHR